MQVLARGERVYSVLDLVSREMNCTFVAVHGTYNGFRTEKSILVGNSLNMLIPLISEEVVFYTEKENIIIQTVRNCNGVTRCKDYFIYKLVDGKKVEELLADKYKTNELKGYLENIHSEVIMIMDA